MSTASLPSEYFVKYDEVKGVSPRRWNKKHNSIVSFFVIIIIN